ncbi:hypothetical protein [Oligoflexus tunisiensis]|uniref:hypothetical protein n=1 Tax=Oligoflexus tunisiensis TaxID=708132 RepID=UPI00114CFE32|nr:hypothetical protein [Oligoflexus tunisiensis]
MKQNPTWQKPWLMRVRRALAASLNRWNRATGWPLQPLAQRLFLLTLLPFYVGRLGLGQGLMTFYRFLLGENGFVIDRSERDPGLMIREDSADAWEFQQVFILQEYRRLAGRHDVRVIIDAGASVGFSSIYLAELYPHAFIYALEADEISFQAMQRNTRHYPNIKPIQAALAQEDGVWERDSSVPTITVSSLMEQYRIPCVDILKMQIKATEARMFETPSCHAWLGSVRVLAMALHPSLDSDAEHPVLEALQSYEFTVRSSGGNLILDFSPAADAAGLKTPQRRFS